MLLFRFCVGCRHPGIEMLEGLAESMGMGLSSCVRAMVASANNAEAAADWLLTNLDEEQTRTEEVGVPCWSTPFGE